MLEQFIEYWPFLVPLILIQFTLVIISLIHIFRHQNYRFGNRVVWVIVVVLFQMIGSIVYLTVGREEE